MFDYFYDSISEVHIMNTEMKNEFIKMIKKDDSWLGVDKVTARKVMKAEFKQYQDKRKK